MGKAAKMYKDSPKLERDDESGKMEAKKPDHKEEEKKDGTEGEDRGGMKDGVPAHARHVIERMGMHHKHENEHHTHDHGKHGDKKEMHGRHQKEMSEMHKRHEKEAGKTGGDMIEKVESDKKED